jgi:hypothetical protein
MLAPLFFIFFLYYPFLECIIYYYINSLRSFSHLPYSFIHHNMLSVSPILWILNPKFIILFQLYQHLQIYPWRSFSLLHILFIIISISYSFLFIPSFYYSSGCYYLWPYDYAGVYMVIYGIINRLPTIWEF